MGNKTPLDEKATDYLGARLDEYHGDLLKKILAKWSAEGKRGNEHSKTSIGQAGIQYIAKLEGLVPDCHLVVADIRPGLHDEEAKLRNEGFGDPDFVNEGVIALALRFGFMGPTKITTNTETIVSEGT